MRYLLGITAAFLLITPIATAATDTPTSTPTALDATTTAVTATSTTTSRSTTTSPTLPHHTATTTLQSAIGNISTAFDYFWEQGQLTEGEALNRLMGYTDNTVDFAKKLEKRKNDRGGLFAWFSNWRTRVLRQIINDRLTYLESRIISLKQEGKIQPQAARRLMEYTAHALQLVPAETDK